MVRLPFGGSSRRGVDGAELLFSFWSTPSLSMVAVSCCSLLCGIQRRKLRDKKEEDDRASFPSANSGIIIGRCKPEKFCDSTTLAVKVILFLLCIKDALKNDNIIFFVD